MVKQDVRGQPCPITRREAQPGHAESMKRRIFIQCHQVRSQVWMVRHPCTAEESSLCAFSGSRDLHLLGRAIARERMVVPDASRKRESESVTLMRRVARNCGHEVGVTVTVMALLR